jgi:endonuclease YncB( thermonuclease family)
MTFKVTEIFDGDTFRVSPGWSWNNKSGDVIRANGYNTPEQSKQGYIASKEKLTKLILHKDVTLTKVIKITYGRLLCDVYINGKNLSSFFPEYQ